MVLWYLFPIWIYKLIKKIDNAPEIRRSKCIPQHRMNPARTSEAKKKKGIIIFEPRIIPQKKQLFLISINRTLYFLIANLTVSLNTTQTRGGYRRQVEQQLNTTQTSLRGR